MAEELVNESIEALQDFQKVQMQFAGHIRNPEQICAPEGLEERRMAIYRELFYNNIEGFISRGFPVLRRLFDDERWHAMVREFLIVHRAKTPYFLEVSETFLDYLQNQRGVRPTDPPFIIELAHYEWVELALEISTDTIPDRGFNPDGDLMRSRILVSPLICVLSYQYPVHRICPEFQPQEPSEELTYLVVYRDLEDNVRYIEINAVSARLLSLLTEQPMLTGRQALEQIAQEMQHPDLNVVIAGGQEMLAFFKERGIVLGTALDIV